MKKITLLSIELQNFMGIKQKYIEFSKGITSLVGANGTGKTTVNTAFRWLLFNKDIQDRTDFEIKTLDSKGKAASGLEHKVTARLEVYEKHNRTDNIFPEPIEAETEGSRIIELTKIYKEIWRKKKGAEQPTFSGHETLYYIDEVPLLKKDYDKQLDEIISESTFKIITDPLYFSEKLHWKDQRKIIVEACGEIADEEVIKHNNELEKLDLEGKRIEDFRSMVKEKRKKFNEELERIPVRIDEVNNSISNHNFDEIKSELLECKRELAEVEQFLETGIENNPQLDSKKKKLYGLNAKIQEIEHTAKLDFNRKEGELKQEINQLSNEANSLFTKAASIRQTMKEITEENQQYEQKLINLRREWTEIDEKQFKADIETTCPTCGQDLPEEDLKNKLEEYKENFNRDKAELLSSINKSGKDIAHKKEQNETAISNYNDEANHYEEEAKKLLEREDKLKDELAQLDIKDFYSEDPGLITELRDSLVNEIENAPEDEAAKIRQLKKERKAQLNKEIDYLSGIMAYKEANAKHIERIEELKKQQKEIASKIAKIEKQEYLSDEFIKTKVGLLQERIDKMFSNVAFRLFETQVNGSIDEVCKPLVNGVPFSDANRAGKINAGIDIINTLCKHYEVSAPIWIDNRESITELIDTNSQIINLTVDPNFPELKALGADNSIKEKIKDFGIERTQTRQINSNPTIFD